MEVRHCDICNEVIKNKVYVLSMLKTSYSSIKTEDFEVISTQDLLKKIQEQRKRVKVQEVCPGCFKVWDYFIKLRLRKLKQIKKTIEEAYKLPVKKPIKKRTKKKKGDK